jgi:putative FmdB family regulatory protein
MTYEYVCEACGHQWEAEQSIKDASLKICVSCGESKAKRLVSGGTGFLLKGGGWYADLYGSSGASAAKTEASKSDDKGGKASPAAKSESTESKPATAETKSGTDSKASTSSATPAASPSTSSSNAKAS